MTDSPWRLRAAPIPAIRWTGDNWRAVAAWARQHGVPVHPGGLGENPAEEPVMVHRLADAVDLHRREGTLRAAAGDWLALIQGRVLVSLPDDIARIALEPAAPPDGEAA